MPTRTAFDNFLSKIKPRHACVYKALKNNKIYAPVGPCIRVDNYEVGKEFYDKFNVDCEKRLSDGRIPRLLINKLKEVEILKLSDEELAVYINFFNT